jgi:hypothetical protein
MISGLFMHCKNRGLQKGQQKKKKKKKNQGRQCYNIAAANLFVGLK